MAKVTTNTIKSDLSGKDGASTTRFSFGAERFAIDLTDDEAAEMRKAFKKYVEKARRVGNGTGTGTNGDAANVRAWALANPSQVPQGVKVGERGRLSQALVEAWRAAGAPESAIEAPATV
jgi:hypothetical protein